MKKIVHILLTVCCLQTCFSADAQCNFILSVTVKCAHIGQCDGAIIPQTANGTAPISYRWPAPTPTCFKAGTYPFTVTDATGCSISANVVVPECTSTATNDLNDWIKVSPNPTTDNVVIDAQNLVIHSVTLTDIFGRVVQKYKNLPTTGPLSIKASGTYFLRIETDKGVLIKKIVKL